MVIKWLTIVYYYYQVLLRTSKIFPASPTATSVEVPWFRQL